jgi:hypothetical protein
MLKATFSGGAYTCNTQNINFRSKDEFRNVAKDPPFLLYSLCIPSYTIWKLYLSAKLAEHVRRNHDAEELQEKENP